VYLPREPNMKLFYTAALLFIFAFAAGAQSPNRIPAQAAKTLGGEKQLKAVSSVQAVGKITRVSDGASGDYRLQTAQPNLFTESFDLDGFEVASGYNGRSAWTRDSRDGVRTLTGDVSRDFQAEAVFRNSLWLNARNQKSKLIYSGTSTVNGKPASLFVLGTAKGTRIKIYFDTVSAFPVRVELPAGTDSKIIEYSDYRRIDGVLQPFTINITAGGYAYVVKLDEVILNRRGDPAAFDYPRVSDGPVPNIKELLATVESNQERVEQILDNYTYTKTEVSREFGSDGALRETDAETIQLTFYKGNRIQRTIAKNGKPLSEDEQKNEDSRVRKRVEEIEKRIQKQDAKEERKSGSSDDRRISIAELLRASRLINPRRERFRGRDVVVFDFEPDPSFDYKNAKSYLRFFGKTAGVMWIDAEDKQVARLEAVLVDSFKVGGGVLANLKKGASFTFEQQRVNDEIWLPSITEINLAVKVLLVKGLSLNQITRYGSYEKFKTEVTDSRVEDSKKP
jgi:hypothetical protein